jgi:hypothetical protein
VLDAIMGESSRPSLAVDTVDALRPVCLDVDRYLEVFVVGIERSVIGYIFLIPPQLAVDGLERKKMSAYQP